MAVLNATVYTSDDGQPTTEAFAVKDGRFLAVGSTDDIQNLVTGDTEVIDGRGLTVTAGFVDAHSHPSGVRELTGVNVDLRTVAEVKEALRRKAAETPPGFWVEGYKYDDTKFVGGRPVTRRDLDEAVPDHPAMVGHRGGHTGVYNSRAFALAGVTAETRDPPGGHFYVENGELTGKVAELARGLFDGVGQRPEVTRETRQAGVKFISEQMTAAGLTTVHNAGGGTESLIAYQDAYEADEMRFRMYMLVRGGLFGDLKASFEEDSKGSITEGKLADFVILADDPHTTDPDEIKNIQVLRTVVGGRTAHEA